MKRNGPIALLFHTCFVVFSLAPILIVCVIAFTPEGYLSLPTKGLSLRWFYEIGRHPEFITAFKTSVILASLASTCAVVVSIPVALAVARYRFIGRELIVSIYMSPLLIPHIVLGIAFLRFFSVIGLNGTFFGLVLSHIVIIIPFALRLTLATATGLGREPEYAAVSLGASDLRAFWRITLPLMLPGIVSGWLFAFIMSFDDLSMTVFIAAPATITLPVRLYAYTQYGIDPLITAVSAAVIFIAVIAMMILDRLFGIERLFLGRGGILG